MLILIHAVATWVLVGLIWSTQWVHYPLLAEVGADRFRSYHRQHLKRTSAILMPPVLVEAACAVLLVMAQPGEWLVWAGLILLACIAGSTALIFAPLHLRLAAGFEDRTVQRLMRLNWLRTIAWTLRGLIAVLLIER